MKLQLTVLKFYICAHSFIVQEATANTAGLKTVEHLKVNDCFYTGEVVDHPSSTITVSMCKGKMVSINVSDV